MNNTLTPCCNHKRGRERGERGGGERRHASHHNMGQTAGNRNFLWLQPQTGANATRGQSICNGNNKHPRTSASAKSVWVLMGLPRVQWCRFFITNTYPSNMKTSRRREDRHRVDAALQLGKKTVRDRQRFDQHRQVAEARPVDLAALCYTGTSILNNCRRWVK